MLVERRDIAEICIADVGKRIIPKHRVDRLRQLSAVRLVDAGSIDPSPVVAVLLRQLKKVSQFAGCSCRERCGVLCQ